MNDLLERRNRAAKTMETILRDAGSEPLTPDQEATFDAASADFDKLCDTLERHAKVEALKLPEPNAIGGVGGTGAVEQITPQRRAFDDFIRSGAVGPGLLRVNDDLETRAQGVATNAAGGFLVPDGFLQGIVRAQKVFGGMQNLATVRTTSTGNDITFPTIDDTGNVGALIAENTAVTEQDVVVGNKILRAFKWTSKLVRVSNELLQDDQYNLDTELGSLLGERIGRAQAPYWITGTGVNEPEGLLTNKAASEVTAAGAVTTLGTSAQAQDSLINLETDLEEAYLANASYLMHRNTLAAVRKIRDADGRAIWQPSFASGQPNTINGYPVNTDPAMPVMAANAKAIAFGDFRDAYVIRIVAAVAIRRLAERYAEFDQTGFLGFARADGIVRNPLSYQILANAAV